MLSSAREYMFWKTCILVQARASTREIPYKGKSSCYICVVVVSVFTWVVSLVHAKAKKRLGTKTKRPSRETTTIKIPSIKTEKQLIQPEPERYLFVVEWLAGCLVLFVLCFFLEGFLFCCVVVVLLFVPSIFKLLPERDTIHYSKHKQTWNGCVHDLCQMLKAMFKFISNYMTFAADLKVVFII